MVAIMVDIYHLLRAFYISDTVLFTHWLILFLQQYYKASSITNIITTEMRHVGICDMSHS